MNMEERRSCYAFREAANLSDHFQVALEVTCKASLLKGTTGPFVNDLRVIQRTPEEQDRHDRLSRVECDSDYEDEFDEQEANDPEVKQVTEHLVTHENVQTEMMSAKWSRTCDAAMALRVFLKREAAEELGKENCDIMKNNVLPLLQKAGWLEEIDEEGLQLTEREREFSDGSWLNKEREEFSMETLTVASTIRLFSRTPEVTNAVSKTKGERRNRMVTTEESKATRSHNVDHPNTLQMGLWKAIKSNPQWKAAVQQRKFGIRGAIHYLRCAKSTNSQVKALLRYKQKGDRDEDFKNVTDRVNNCLRERQIRRVQENKESEASRIAAEQEETQILQIKEDPKLIATLEENNGRPMQELTSERDEVPRVIPREWTRLGASKNGFEVNACRMSDREMGKILKQTTAKRTTRIRGSITVGNWTETRKQAQEMNGENAEFAEAEFEDDILLDTGCSYTIVSLAWVTAYCRRHNIDLKSVLIRYPEGYEAPCANTAAEDSPVHGIGFARIKLNLVTLRRGQSLKWNQGDMCDGGGAMEVELDTYVRVFENMGSPFLLGMPFIQQFTHAWDFIGSQISLKGEAGGQGISDTPRRRGSDETCHGLHQTRVASKSSQRHLC